MRSVSWNGSMLLQGDVEAGMWALKTESAGELLVLGSPRLTANLARFGLLDELRIMINPVALGHGKSLFNSMFDRLNLNLLDARQFDSGNVLLTYRPSS